MPAIVYGAIDPSDGIAFRAPARIDAGARPLHHPSDRGIYRHRRRWRVCVRYRGVLFRIGSYRTLAAARAARDCFRRAVFGRSWREIAALRTFVARERAAGRLPSVAQARLAAEACC